MSKWFADFGLAAVDRQGRLLTGAFPTDASDVDTLRELGVDVVVNLCEDAEYPDGAREQTEIALSHAGIDEHRVPFTDFGGFNRAQLDAGVTEVLRHLDSGSRVYLHCRAGHQRSASVATAALALKYTISLGEALKEIQQRNPNAEPLDHQWQDLNDWYRMRTQRSIKRGR